MRFNLDNFDTVIAVVDNITEARTLGSTPVGSNVSLMDPRMGRSIVPANDFINILRTTGAGAEMSFGSAIRSTLQMGPGFATEVVDYGDAVTVKISYTNIKTGKSASQNFIILFRNKYGASYVKTNSARWRTCSDYAQAASFIRSKASYLAGKTSGTN